MISHKTLGLAGMLLDMAVDDEGLTILVDAAVNTSTHKHEVVVDLLLLTRILLGELEDATGEEPARILYRLGGGGS